MVDDGVWLEESGVLDLAYTEVGLLPEFTAEVSEEGSLRVLAWYHLASSFIGGLLEESANVLRHFVLESIEAVVLCAFADNGLQVGLGDFDIHRNDIGNDEAHGVVLQRLSCKSPWMA